LLDDFREVHQQYRDSEHPFALLETRTIRRLFAGSPLAEVASTLRPAFDAFNAVRRSRLRLYPGVRQALSEMCRSGVVLVAHTESKLHAVKFRLTHLKLTQSFRHIYCIEGAPINSPSPIAPDERGINFPMEKVRVLSHHQRKPDTAVLLEICNREHIQVTEAAYVGDSLVRDVFLARSAGVFAIWAKYGVAHNRDEYRKLLRITHWTDNDVSRERALSEAAQDVEPDYVLERSFGEIIEALRSGSRVDL
jgi:phosphoglycolate phosphatase